MATNFHTVVINRNRLLRYKLRAISKNNIYEKQIHQKVQVGKDQEKVQSERDSHSKNRGGKKPN